VWTVPPLLGLSLGTWFFWAVWLVAALYGFLSRQVALVPLLFVGPLLLAGATIDRGDGDGLWILIYPMLLVAGVFALLPAYIGKRLGCRVRR